MDKIKTIIAGTRPGAKTYLKRVLNGHKPFEIIRVCSGSDETMLAIDELNPDLLLIDFQIGLELLDVLADYTRPKVVFMAGYDDLRHKVLNAKLVDYLDEFPGKTRASTAIRNAERSRKTVSGVDYMDNGAPEGKLFQTFRNNYKDSTGRIVIKESGKFLFLDTSEIDRIESAGNYVKIVSGDKHYTVRETLKRIAKKLDPMIFFRIHRSTIVNIRKIKMIEPWFRGDYQIIMQNGTRLNMSRNYTELLTSF